MILQCLQSSLAQEGGANHWQLCITDLQTTLKTWIGRSKELPEIFEIVLRPFWWAAGSEQPSPPLHRAAAARLLRRSCVLQQYFFPPHIICISQCFANHISDGRRVWLTELVMHSGCASTQLLLIITAAAHISCLYLSKWWIVFPNLSECYQLGSECYQLESSYVQGKSHQWFKFASKCRKDSDGCSAVWFFYEYF